VASSDEALEQRRSASALALELRRRQLRLAEIIKASKSLRARWGRIDFGNRVKATLSPSEVARLKLRNEVLGKVGGRCSVALFAPDTSTYKQPVSFPSVDGLATTLKLSFAMDRHDRSAGPRRILLP